MTTTNIKQAYTFGIDSYGTDNFECVTVVTSRETVLASSDKHAIAIAYKRKDVSYIERPDGSHIQRLYPDPYRDNNDWSNSNYNLV
jgi:hypothetical protein